MPKISNERLSEIFMNVGKDYGYEEINAEFLPFRVFNIKWSRTDTSAYFRVSDYLEDEPEEVLEVLAEGLFSRMHYGSDVHLSTIVHQISTPEFAERKQPKYLRRLVGITKTPQGEFKNLNDSIARLKEQGLLSDEDIRGVFLAWLKVVNANEIGNTSALMKVVSISKMLDSDAVPDFVLDYAVYHEMCYIKLGLESSGIVHEKKFAALEEKYEKKDEAKERLKRLCQSSFHDAV